MFCISAYEVRAVGLVNLHGGLFLWTAALVKMRSHKWGESLNISETLMQHCHLDICHI